MRVYTIWFKLPRKKWHITRSCIKKFSIILSATHTKLQNEDIPIILGNKSVMLNTDIAASNILLLLSKLIVTRSGSCAISVRRYGTILSNATTGVNKCNPISI